MKTINVIDQNIAESKSIEIRFQGNLILSIHDQFGDVIDFDKQGAAELIKVLQEWVGNE